MNNSSKKLVIISSVIILIVTVMYFYFKNYSPKYRWNENYDYESVQPYGLKLAVDILSETYTKNNIVFINKPLHDIIKKEDTGALYIFIGENYICDSLLSENLADFVKRGNNAFVSSIGGEHLLFKILTNENFPTINYNFLADSFVNISFVNVFPKITYKFDYKYGKKLKTYKWLGIDSTFLSDSLSMYGFEAISGSDYALQDCIRVKHGKGWFIFHSNPLFFSYYNLSKEVGFNYINQLFSKYRKPKILWDEYSRSAMDNSSITSTQESPLRFILSEKSLRWSWYLICLLIIMFILVNSKRKQAHIPLIPANNNTTIEFINSIAMLYFNNYSTAFLANEMMKQFRSFAKHKYGISPGINKNDIPKLLAPLSGIPENELDKLFQYYTDVIYSTYNESKILIKLHSQIEYFYQNCK